MAHGVLEPVPRAGVSKHEGGQDDSMVPFEHTFGRRAGCGPLLVPEPMPPSNTSHVVRPCLHSSWLTGLNNGQKHHTWAACMHGPACSSHPPTAPGMWYPSVLGVVVAGAAAGGADAAAARAVAQCRPRPTLAVHPGQASESTGEPQQMQRELKPDVTRARPSNRSSGSNGAAHQLQVQRQAK